MDRRYEITIAPKAPRTVDDGLSFTVTLKARCLAHALSRIGTYFGDFIVTGWKRR